MNSDEDFILALQLQEQFEREINVAQVKSFTDPKPKKSHSAVGNTKKSNDGISIIDPSWEYIDPTPDVHALFIQFDRRFFWGTLKQVEVRWSPRMTTCAGICYYEGRGGFCSIRLSVPLLKLRPRKDLVETLLHEMIHAFLFVTHNNRDRDGHGPEFHKHMNRINKDAGTKITVYHSFHDEVKLYQQHWWRCGGPCQKCPPYFGMVKRSMNRAPGPNDIWWSDHEKTCGGRFIKVREPDGFSGKKVKQNKNSSHESSSKMGDISRYFPVQKNENGNKTKGNIVSLSDTSSNKNRATSSNNIVGTKDLNGTGAVKKGKSPASNNTSSGQGNIVSLSDMSSNKNKVTSSNNIAGMKDLNGTGAVKKGKSPASDSTSSGKGNKMGGMLANKGSGTLVITAKGKNKEQNSTSKVADNFIPFSGKGNILGGTDSKSKIVTSNDAAVTLKRPSFVTEQIVSEKKSKIDVVDCTTVECPVCENKVDEDQINSHLDSCMQEMVKDESDTVKCPACDKCLEKRELAAHLEVCLGSIFQTEDIGDKADSEDDEYPCPCCAALQKHSTMNSHLDQCLSSVWDE